jgi:Zn finger protein HypA/HybF involved in hydrogenase expression
MSALPAPRHGTYGRLDYDEVIDGLLCHCCGRWYRNLAQHARLAHGVGADDYRDLAGLNRQTRLVTPTMRAAIRERTAPLIARLRDEGKLRHWGEDRERWEADKAAAVETLHDGIRPEGRARRREALTPERREALAERTRRRNLAGEGRAMPGAIAVGLRRAAAATGPRACEACGREYTPTAPRQRYCPDCARERARASWRDYASRRRRARGVRGGPRQVACARCGATFAAASNSAKYCPDCRPVAYREGRRGR